MRLFVVSVCCLSCAGPSVTLGANSAASTTQPPAPRPSVATTLTADDPLEARPCQLPTAPETPCLDAPTEHHHHHHHGQTLQEDPICGMTVSPESAEGGSLQVEGRKVWFCSTRCRDAFKTEHPEAKE
jgi:YHS domain-containing protein